MLEIPIKELMILIRPEWLLISKSAGILALMQVALSVWKVVSIDGMIVYITCVLPVCFMLQQYETEDD